MDFEATIEAKKLKHAVTVLRRVNDEAVFEIGENGLTCRLVDAANTQLTQVAIARDAWDLFEFDEAHRIGVDLDRTASALARATAKDVINISGDDSAWHFTRGIHRRSPRLRDLAELRKPPTRPELLHTVWVTLSGKEFKEIVANAEDVGEALMITARSKGVSFDAHPVDEDQYHGELDAGRLEMQMDIHDAQAVYTLEYLHDIAVDTRASDEVTWRFGADMPCEIGYTRDGVEVNHILAPRIESD